MAAVRKYLAEAGLTVCAPKRYEADDVMRSIAHQADCKVVLGTVDKDLIQALIDDHVHMWTKTGGYLDVRKLKVPPERMLVYQTLHGDTIDNVPQLVTEAPAIRTANAFASINDYAHSSDESMEWCLQWRDELTRNHKLVKLVTDLDVPLSAPIEFRGHGWYPKSYNELRDFVRMQQNPNRLFHRRY
jgi:5'-3' exonuclease